MNQSIEIYHYTRGCEFKSCKLCEVLTKFCNSNGLVNLIDSTSPTSITFNIEHRSFYPTPLNQDCDKDEACPTRKKFSKIIVENIDRSFSQRIICFIQCSHMIHRIDYTYDLENPIGSSIELLIGNGYSSEFKIQCILPNDRKRSRDSTELSDGKPLRKHPR